MSALGEFCDTPSKGMQVYQVSEVSFKESYV